MTGVGGGVATRLGDRAREGAGGGRRAAGEGWRDRCKAACTSEISEDGLEARRAVARVAQQLAGMLPATQLLPTRHRAEVRIPTVSCFYSAIRCRQRAAALGAAVPPAALLVAAGFKAEELFLL